MRLASWNMNHHNRIAMRGVEQLYDAGHDVLCLQEVPEHLLPELARLPGDLFACDEYTDTTGLTSKLVILSRRPIQAHTVHQHKEYYSLRNWWGGMREGISFHHVDLLVGNQPTRIFNLHLPLNAPPRARMREWMRVKRRFRPDGHNIMCGDFNAFADPLWSLLVAPFFGYGFKLRDRLMNERQSLRRFIQRYQLENPFARWRTQVHLPHQLDFILLSKGIEALNANRWPDRLGSDHWPLSLKLKLPVVKEKAETRGKQLANKLIASSREMMPRAMQELKELKEKFDREREAASKR